MYFPDDAFGPAQPEPRTRIARFRIVKLAPRLTDERGLEAQSIERMCERNERHPAWRLMPLWRGARLEDVEKAERAMAAAAGRLLDVGTNDVLLHPVLQLVRRRV